MTMTMQRERVNLGLLFAGDPRAVATERLPGETEAAKPGKEMENHPLA